MTTITPASRRALARPTLPDMPASAILGLVALLKIALLVGLGVWLYRRTRKHELRKISWRR